MDVVCTPEIAKRFLLLFEKGASIDEACLRLGIDQKTFFKWQSQYPIFKDALELAELSAEYFYEDLLQEAIDYDVDEVYMEIIEIMQKRFPDSYL